MSDMKMPNIDREKCAKIAESWVDPEHAQFHPDAIGCSAALNEGLECTAPAAIAKLIRAEIPAPSDLETLLDDACGTLADIGFSDDLTLSGCRKKAQKRYAAIRSITDPEEAASTQARIEAAEPDASTTSPAALGWYWMLRDGRPWHVCQVVNVHQSGVIEYRLAVDSYTKCWVRNDAEHTRWVQLHEPETER